MELQARFKVDGPKITHETIDGEAIVINLENGNYYSLEKIGAEVWNGIMAGLTQKEIVNHIVSQYIGKPAEIERAVTVLIEQLVQENLIGPDTNQEHPRTRTEVFPEVSKNGSAKTIFEAPALQKFDDMQDLLLLDPIHDVDETGWPHSNKDAVK